MRAFKWDMVYAAPKLLNILEVRLRFLHERILLEEIEFARISTKDQLADGFTKALPGPAFTIFREQLLKGSNSDP